MANRDRLTELPAGFQYEDEMSPEPPEGFHYEDEESLSELPEATPAEDDSYLGNLAAGFGERATTLGGSFLDAVSTIGEGLEDAMPLGGLVWEDGDVLPSVLSPEEFAKRDAPSVLRKGAEVLKNIDLGYQERTNWQDVKGAFSEGGAFSGSAYADVVAYATEQGIKSIPDMVAVITAFPAYIVARSGEIGEQRAQNKGKDRADITDVLEAFPAAAASAFLERIGAKGMTSGAKAQIGKELMQAGVKNAAKRVAKASGSALAKEATTEAIQEGMIEYVGERYGTDVAMDFYEALDRGTGAAVAGGLFGGAVGGGTATAAEVARPPIAPAEIATEATVEAVAPEASHDAVTKDVADISQATSVDDAVNAADSVITQGILDHRRKMASGVPPSPRVQDSLTSLFGEAQKTPEQIKSQQLLDFEAEKESGVATAEKAPESAVSDRAKAQVESRRNEKARPTDVLVSDLVLSKDVQQIKSGADAKGVVEPLGGSFDPVGTGPLQVWVRNNGTQEVISGRHRLDLAQRSGTKTVAVQKHFEDEGFNLQDAKSLDALLNIREGQGKVKDYVSFIKTNDMTIADAETQGVLARSTGKQAFAIATHGSDLLIDAHAAERITDSAATRIATAAPNSPALQAVGIEALEAGKSITLAENTVKAMSTIATPQQQQSTDLFGFDTSALVGAESLGKKAGAKQAGIQKTLSAIQGAAKDPKRAAKEGVDVKSPEDVKRRIAELKQQKSDWSRWQTDTKLVATLKADIANDAQVEKMTAREETQALNALVETAPAVVESPQGDLDLGAKADSKQVDDAFTRFEAYKSTLDTGVEADQKGFERFMKTMKTEFNKVDKFSPEGTITNQKDFTQFVQAQAGQKIPLGEINLTRKIRGKDGKMKVVQVKADTVLRQTRKKRDLALGLLRCIYG